VKKFFKNETQPGKKLVDDEQKKNHTKKKQEGGEKISKHKENGVKKEPLDQRDLSRQCKARGAGGARKQKEGEKTSQPTKEKKATQLNKTKTEERREEFFDWLRKRATKVAGVPDGTNQLTGAAV